MRNASNEGDIGIVCIDNIYIAIILVRIFVCLLHRNIWHNIDTVMNGECMRELSSHTI